MMTLETNKSAGSLGSVEAKSITNKSVTSLVPRVANLQRFNGAKPLRHEPGIANSRDRLDDGMRRLYDPVSEAPVGLDAPGIHYEQQHNTLGNEKQ